MANSLPRRSRKLDGGARSTVLLVQPEARNGGCFSRIAPESCAATRLARGLPYFVQRSNITPLVNIVITLIVVGVALWAINTYIPMASSIKSILNAVVVIATLVWLLQITGVWGGVGGLRVGR